MQISCGRCAVLRHNLNNAERWVTDLEQAGPETAQLRQWRGQANRLSAELALAQAEFELWLEKGEVQ